jgi:soluble lytic murein transglycosylase-like protein
MPGAEPQNIRKSGGCLSGCAQWFVFSSVFAALLFILLSVLAAFEFPRSLQINEPAYSRASAVYSIAPVHFEQAACQVSSRFPEKVLRWCHWITEYALQHDLPPDLVAALIWQESGGNPLAYSRSGAVGLMQVMPSDGIAEKFMCKNGPCFADRPNTLDLQDAEFNVSYGTKMLRGLINHHKGDLRKALKSYGPMDVGYHYADTVLALYNRYGAHTQP